MLSRRTLNVLASAATAITVVALVYRGPAANGELPNRLPEPAPYVAAEAQFVPPPFEAYWETLDHPGQCQTCHQRVFAEWNGSMMANAWRDPIWRGAFLLSSRETATMGDCETPDPPDGTTRAHHNPFALASSCASVFDLGTSHYRMERSGSLLDGTCSRCHMPTNYVDNVPLQNVSIDAPSGVEHGRLDPNFNPTSPNGTGLTFATVAGQHRNTDSGKSGVACMVCHSFVDTRDTPFHNSASAAAGHTYVPALGTRPRADLVPPTDLDILDVPDQHVGNLGYSIGGGSFRLSPHSIGVADRPGPLTSKPHADAADKYLSGVFGQPTPYEQMDSTKHHGFRQVLSARAEFCSSCHDVTNPLTIKNRVGKWVGGFPIERTYAEWASSRYADRPGNASFDPGFKRDCQTCHMQQDYGQPGTAQTLYSHGTPVRPMVDSVASGTPPRTYFSHHFIGGNAYVPTMIGTDIDESGNVQPYPELSEFSFSSGDEKSVYANAFWTNVDHRGGPSQQARLAWDRLRNVLDLAINGPAHASPGTRALITVKVANTGSGHNFPTGFPEGRVAWLSVHAFDLASGQELAIYDAFWKRTSLGVGGFTKADMVDPNFPGCNWQIPAGSPDPFAYQLKAVASLGDGCPTLDLVYAAPLNMVTNAKGLPIDARGVAIDRRNPRGLPQFLDRNGNGDLYDDAFLTDTRLRPLPHAGATVSLDRYSVLIPRGAAGPVAVTAAVYYQSVEAIVAKKFLGNLADTNTNFVLEPCVLGGPCDGRRPSVEPPVVEGAPPVPMEVRNWVIQIEGGEQERVPPRITGTYPRAGATGVFQDVVIKAFFSRPVQGVDRATFTLADARGHSVTAAVDQVGDGTWALFPSSVFLAGGETYTARLASGLCDETGGCTTRDVVWRFTVSGNRGEGAGDTTIPIGFPPGLPRAPIAPAVKSVNVVRNVTPADRSEALQVVFSRPVMNVTPMTLAVQRKGDRVRECSAADAMVTGDISSNRAGDLWTFTPHESLAAGAEYCVSVSGKVYDLSGHNLEPSLRTHVKIGDSRR